MTGGIGHLPMLARRLRRFGDTARRSLDQEGCEDGNAVCCWRRASVRTMTMRGMAEAASEMHVTMWIQSCARASSSVSGLISSRLPTIPITNSTHHTHTMPVEVPESAAPLVGASGVRFQVSLTTSAGMIRFASGMNQPPIAQPGVHVLEVMFHNSVFFDARKRKTMNTMKIASVIAEDEVDRVHGVGRIVGIVHGREGPWLLKNVSIFDRWFAARDGELPRALTIDAPRSQVNAVVSPGEWPVPEKVEWPRARHRGNRSGGRRSEERRFRKAFGQIERVGPRNPSVGDPLRPALAVPVAVLSPTERIRVPVRYRVQRRSHDAGANVGRPIARPSVRPTM